MTIVLLGAFAWLAANVLVVALCTAARLGDETPPLLGRPPRLQRPDDADPGFVLTIATPQADAAPRPAAPRSHANR